MLGQLIVSAANNDGVKEVFVEVIHVFDHSALKAAGDSQVIEDREMLDVLAEADAARMRSDGDAELGGH